MDLQQKINNLNLSEKVFLPGYSDRANQYLSCFNVFVLSSLTEGLPITLLEAMQAKKPIVATKVGGVPDVLEDGHGGLLTEPGKPEELAEAIKHIYNDAKLAKKFISFSFNKVINKYSSKTMAQKYLNIYRKAIGHL